MFQIEERIYIPLFKKRKKKMKTWTCTQNGKCMWHVIDRSELLLVDNLDRGNKNIKFTCTEKYKLARERKEECFNSLAYSRTISLHRWVNLLKSQNLWRTELSLNMHGKFNLLAIDSPRWIMVQSARAWEPNETMLLSFSFQLINKYPVSYIFYTMHLGRQV